MPKVRVIKSPDQELDGVILPFHKEGLSIGRGPEPDTQNMAMARLQMPRTFTAISRKQAMIVHEKDSFYLFDPGARNETLLNSQPIVKDGRHHTALKDGDRIKICDFVLLYEDDQNPQPKPLGNLLKSKQVAEPEPDDNDVEGTTIQARYERLESRQFLETQPSEKLRAILEISTALGKTLHVETLFPKIADELFKVFKQADRCFIIELNEQGLMIPVVSKTRRQNAEETRFSRSVVRKCIDTLESFIMDDATGNAGLGESVMDLKIRSIMCVPLVSQDNKAMGVIQLDNQDRNKKFSEDDLKLLVCVSAQASIALENARLHESVIERHKLEEDRKAASKVQRGFLPQRNPNLPGYEFYSHYIAAKNVGGDYYDFIALSDGRQAVLLGDVSGKGVPAALLMARLSGEARVSVLTQTDIAKSITHLNEQLMQANLEDRYVTLSAAIIDPKTHEIELVSAGHLSPIIVKQGDGRVTKIFDKDVGDFPVGWVPGHEYSALRVKLEPGDTYIVYTDGIEDAQPASAERFGDDRVMRTLQETIDKDPNASAMVLGKELLTRVKAHAGNHDQFDDIAMVAFSRLSPQVSPPTSSG